MFDGDLYICPPSVVNNAGYHQTLSISLLAAILAVISYGCYSYCHTPHLWVHRVYHRTLLCGATNINRVLLKELPTLDAIVKYAIFFIASTISRLYLKHRRNPICGLADIITEAVDVRLDKIFLTDDFLLRLALHA